MTPRFKPVAVLPTLCTLGNTFCGFLAIAKITDAMANPAQFATHVVTAAALILLAMVFDALDGKIARITNQASDFGAQLDSLTDLVTFGVAPALLAKAAYEHAMLSLSLPYERKVVLIVSFLYATCALLRLARFTIETDNDDEAHEKFYGLPSPAAAGVVAASIFLIYERGSPFFQEDTALRLNLVRGLLWTLPVLGLLMVSRVEYVHLVSRWFRGRRSFFHMLAILLALVLIVGNHEVAFFILFAGYAIAGPLLAISERMLGRKLLVPSDGDDDLDAGPDPLLDGERSPSATALIALGSNLGDRASHLRHAIDELRKLPRCEVIATSGFLETEPVGGPPQRAFLNGAVLLRTSLPPRELLRRLSAIEEARGRERSVKNGPRVLDLDLVLYGGVICETSELTLPHPRFRERRFVLEPAAEIAGALVDPVTGKDIATLLADLREKSRP
jgi:CDP-diacylglycerol--serine O-phosphatidyltransferase